MKSEQTDTALLVMDMQTAFLSTLSKAAAFITSVNKAITKARAGGIPVIYTAVGFRPGAPEVSPNNKGFAAGRARFSDVKGEELLAIDPAVDLLETGITVVKRRFSAFAGSDLEVLLRSMGVSHMILTGLSTSGVVLSTLREAADKDYQITVLSDCCADRDEEVQNVLMTKVFPVQAEVMVVDDWQAIRAENKPS